MTQVAGFRQPRNMYQASAVFSFHHRISIATLSSGSSERNRKNFPGIFSSIYACETIVLLIAS